MLSDTATDERAVVTPVREKGIGSGVCFADPAVSARFGLRTMLNG